jgi:hypothetical protein
MEGLFPFLSWPRLSGPLSFCLLLPLFLDVFRDAPINPGYQSLRLLIFLFLPVMSDFLKLVFQFIPTLGRSIFSLFPFPLYLRQFGI